MRISQQLLSFILSCERNKGEGRRHVFAGNIKANERYAWIFVRCLPSKAKKLLFLIEWLITCLLIASKRSGKMLLYVSR